MGNKHREAIVATGLICGYVATVLQSTDGPANIFKGLRYAVTWGLEHKFDKNMEFLRQLTSCGWCLSPYLTLIGYPIVRKALHAPKQGLPELLVGYATATALTGFLRHFADTY